GRSAHEATNPFRRPQTSAAQLVQADATATQPLPTSMVRVAGPQPPVADKPQVKRTTTLRTLAPGPSPAALPEAPPTAPVEAHVPDPVKVLPPSAVSRGPVLPVPPRDEEKFQYVRRNAWILTLFSVTSFPLLVFSQVRLMIQYHWFWIYSPCIL